MATYENRSRYFVRVLKRPDLYREFPHDQQDAAKAYYDQLAAQSLKPKLEQFEDKILVRVRSKGVRPQQYTAGSWTEVSDITRSIAVYRLPRGPAR